MSEDIELPDIVDEESSILQEFESKFDILTTASNNSDSKLVLKVLRELPPLRKKLSLKILVKLISEYYSESDFQFSYLSKILDTKIEIDSEKVSEKQLTPEIDVFVHLLSQLFLIDHKLLNKCQKLNEKIIELFKSYNKRSLDYLQAKCWFYIQRTCELLDAKNGGFHNLTKICRDLLISLRTATLKHDFETTGSIITLLLRSYILTNELNQAINLVSKVDFPENCGNNLTARYYYYLSKINTIQLNYTTALNYIINSIRKAPQNKYVTGFLITANKLRILIELLMGDIPSLQIFLDSTYSKSLKPYMEITKAVRTGDLSLFNKSIDNYKSIFVKDDNFSLILRLRKNVIKTGIRSISLCYKKISIKDVCIKLKMDSEVSTEYILNKLIKDHIIDATLDYEHSYMQCKEFNNVYDSEIPSTEFNNRIAVIHKVNKGFAQEMNYPETKDKLDNSPSEYDEELELLRAEDGFDDLF